MSGVLKDLIDGFDKGSVRSLARLITKIENEDQDKDEVLRRIYDMTGKAYIVGVTGSPGVGKSSLVDRLVEYIRKKGETAGIIAVDPTSPFSGGALLGDRVRMQNHAADSGVYIRSMGTRGSLGGLARATKDVVKAIDAFGYNWIIVETVGVGQAELDIMYVADTTIVVLTPQGGDAIQTIKAGIMEIADIFVVNKSDLPGADRVEGDINQMLDQRGLQTGWKPPVVKACATEDEGIGKLLAAIFEHREYLEEKGLFCTRRKDRLREETLDILNHKWQKRVKMQLDGNGEISGILKGVQDNKMNPYKAAEKILAGMLDGKE